MKKDKAHPSNVEGDFYVLEGCCTLCGVPEMNAPDLFGIETPPKDQYGHCFVKRQPITEDEFERMVKTMIESEFECVRFRGDDESIRARITTGAYGYSGKHLID